jgi:hypothetical protein
MISAGESDKGAAEWRRNQLKKPQFNRNGGSRLQTLGSIKTFKIRANTVDENSLKL